jgi:hypothetical protein
MESTNMEEEVEVHVANTESREEQITNLENLKSNHTKESSTKDTEQINCKSTLLMGSTKPSCL